MEKLFGKFQIFKMMEKMFYVGIQYEKGNQILGFQETIEKRSEEIYNEIFKKYGADTTMGNKPCEHGQSLPCPICDPCVIVRR